MNERTIVDRPPSAARGSAAIRAALMAVAEGRAGARTLLVDDAAAAAAELAAAGALCLTADCERPFPLPFAPVSDLLRALAPLIEREQPDLLVELGPELLALVPEYAGRSYLANTPPINAIAIGGTKRRLHKDSEQLFRIVHSFASLVLEAQRRCGSLAHVPLALVLDHVDAADRLSLSCIHHLSRRLGDASVLIVLAAPDLDTGVRPWLWADEFDAELSDDAAALTDAYAVHGALYREVIRSMQPLDVRTGLVGAAPAPVTRADRVARRAAAAPLERARLHAALAEQLARQPLQSEAALMQYGFHALRSGDRRAGLDALLGAAGAALGFSMQFETVLFCCREVLRHTAGRPDEAVYVVAAWQLVGITHSYLENQEGASRALENAFVLANAPELRSQTCYYAGLVAAKRQRDHGAGRDWFERGMSAIAECATPEAELERGWLCNGLAFIAWRQGGFDGARDLVLRALALTEGKDGGQFLNLRTNLLNNLSLLYEERGEIAKARATWEQLGVWTELPGSTTLAKSYHYRRGWLYLRDGDVQAALACCSEAFTVAERVRDLFHMDLISRACGYFACRLGQFEDAERWFRYNLTLRGRLDDGPGLAEAWASLGHTAVQAGNAHQAAACFRAGVAAATVARCDELAGRLWQAVDAVERGEEILPLEADGDFCGLRLQRPKAKLTTPFALAHLSSAVAFTPAIHRSVLGAARQAAV